MSSSMISPLRFTGSRLTGTSAGRSMATTSHSVSTQEADKDINKLNREAMQQRSQQISALQKVNESLITKQRPLQKQTPHMHLASLLQSVRTLHTNVRMPEFIEETSASEDIMSIHNEALESRQQQMQKIHQARSSLITNKKPKQMQQTQFESVRSLHTNARVSESIEEVSESSDILSLHTSTIKQRQQQMKKLSQTRGSLITNKRPVHMHDPQFQSVRSLHTNSRVQQFSEEVPSGDDILSLHTEAINQRQLQLQHLSKLRETLISNKINATKIKENLSALK